MTGLVYVAAKHHASNEVRLAAIVLLMLGLFMAWAGVEL